MAPSSEETAISAPESRWRSLSSFQVIKLGLHLLRRPDRRKYALMTLAQMSLSILDLVGVVLIGLIVGSAASWGSGAGLPESVSRLTFAWGPSAEPEPEWLLLLSLATAAVLLMKTGASAYIARRILRFLAYRQALIAGQLAEQYLSLPMLRARKRSSQEAAFALTTGVSALVVRVLGNASTVLVEGSLMVLLVVALVVIDPVMTLVAGALFSSVGAGLHWYLSARSERNSRTEANSEIESVAIVQDALHSFREMVVSNSQEHFAERFRQERLRAVTANASLQFVAQAPKYVFEAALILGAVLLCTIQFALNDAVTAVTSIAVFLAAATRVTPSLLRLQGAILNIRGGVGVVAATTDVLAELEEVSGGSGIDPVHGEVASLASGSTTIEAAVSIEVYRVTFSYPGAEAPAIEDLSLEVPPGSSLALVGSTGCGKTTLADLMIGCLTPSSGKITIAHLDPRKFIRVRPFAVSYVPQDVNIVRGTVRENVALGVNSQDVDEARVWAVLEQVRLADLLRHDRAGLDTLVGERGAQLSGGQRQRIGIARALYRQPSLIVLDEATSALDADTESLVMDAISGLEGVTRVVIAHRLSTVLNVDKVAFLEAGRLVDMGSFEELRQRVPQFANLVQLNGLA